MTIGAWPPTGGKRKVIEKKCLHQKTRKVVRKGFKKKVPSNFFYFGLPSPIYGQCFDPKRGANTIGFQWKVLP